MTGLRERVAALCARLPGAEVSDPWGGGHDAWRVGGTMFASIGAVTPGVAVKCADVETAAMLIDAGIAGRAPCVHRSWALLPEDAAEDELAHRLRTSYALVRAKLPKRIRAGLAPGEAG